MTFKYRYVEIMARIHTYYTSIPFLMDLQCYRYSLCVLTSVNPWEYVVPGVCPDYVPCGGPWGGKVCPVRNTFYPQLTIRNVDESLFFVKGLDRKIRLETELQRDMAETNSLCREMCSYG